MKQCHGTCTEATEAHFLPPNHQLMFQKRSLCGFRKHQFTYVFAEWTLVSEMNLGFWVKGELLWLPYMG